jgi:alpha-glucosidase
MPITAGTLGQLREVSQIARDIVFSFESSNLVLTPLLPNAVRHTWVPTHWRLYAEKVKESYAVPRRHWPAGPPAKIMESSDKVRVEVGDLLIEATRDPFHLRYCAADGKAFLEEDASGGLSWSYWDYALRYATAPDDHFYGMGQANQLEARVDLDHRGHIREVWNQHSPPATTIFPALWSLRGYGLLIDNPVRARWDLGHTDPQSFSYEARGGGLQYYVLFGPGLPRLLRTYLELTGFPPLPPRWVLGLLQSRYGYKSRSELEAIAETFRAKHLPCDALILDVFWFREMGDLAFDPLNWPDPKEMIARLKQQGFRTMLIEEPYLTLRSRNYMEAQTNGFLARHFDGSPYSFDFWPGESALIDFSNPAARSWWTAKHRSLIEMDVDGWWTDLNEPAKHFPDMAHHGGSAAAVHNSTALFTQQAVYDAHQQYAPDKRIFILSRSGFAGSQRYGAALWSGDVDMTFAALRKQLAVALNVGLAGIPLWGSDIGGFGFEGKCTAELYARWFQFGAFCPLFRPHGDQRELREPWQFGREVEDICRKYLRLRYRLLPYIYNVLHAACTTGTPILRPLLMEFPDDASLYNLSDQYLFGPDILVAPILDEGATERNVYLPDGLWIDFWTDDLLRGPGSITVQAPLDTIPLFMRQGAVIPMGPDLQYSSEHSLDPLTLAIYPGGDRSLTLYEDDGETTAYQNGEYATTNFTVTHDMGQLVCRLQETEGRFPDCRAARTIVLNFHHWPTVSTVTYDNGPLPARATSQAFEGAQSGWWHNQSAKSLWIKLPPETKARTVRVST